MPNHRALPLDLPVATVAAAPCCSCGMVAGMFLVCQLIEDPAM
jgi:hypothetical protein